jgi:hypothetical protein
MNITRMKMLVVLASLMALADPSHAAQKTKATQDTALTAKKCRQIVGREEPEATDGKSHMGQLNVQRFSDCMMGTPRY